MNSVNIIGNMVADPELRTTKSGTSVCDIRIAVNEGYGDKKVTHFFNVSSWGKLAETVKEYTQKGTRIAVSGALRQENWESKEGEKRSSVSINANSITFLNRTNESGNGNGSSEENKNDSKDNKNDSGDEGDLPF